METTTEKKTIDLTPTWEQWVHLGLTIALRAKDTQKVIETLEPDFNKMARAADAFNQIPKVETIDLISEAAKLIKYQSEGQTDSNNEPVYPELVGKLEDLHSVLIGILEKFE